MQDAFKMDFQWRGALIIITKPCGQKISTFEPLKIKNFYPEKNEMLIRDPGMKEIPYYKSLLLLHKVWLKKLTLSDNKK